MTSNCSRMRVEPKMECSVYGDLESQVQKGKFRGLERVRMGVVYAEHLASLCLGGHHIASEGDCHRA